MKIISKKDSNFFKDLNLFLESRIQDSNKEVDLEVKKIIDKVKEKGDEALFYFSKKFDGVDLNNSSLLISRESRNKYKNKINKKVLEDFKTSIDNVTNFHQKQFPLLSAEGDQLSPLQLLIFQIHSLQQLQLFYLLEC